MSATKTSRSTEAASQGVEHSPHLFKELDDLLSLLSSTQSELDRQGQLGIQFGGRSFSVRNELYKTARSMTGLSFRDVRWNRHRSSSHLGDEAETLFVRKRGCQSIHSLGQTHRLLPYNQIPITPWFSCLRWFHLILLELREESKRSLQTSRGSDYRESDKWLVMGDEREAHCIVTSAVPCWFPVSQAINSALVTHHSSLFSHASPPQH